MPEKNSCERSSLPDQAQLSVGWIRLRNVMGRQMPEYLEKRSLRGYCVKSLGMYPGIEPSRLSM